MTSFPRVIGGVSYHGECNLTRFLIMFGLSVREKSWKGLRVKYSFSYREIDISTPNGQELAERHSIRATPATIINGRLVFIGVPPRQSAEKALGPKT